MSAGECSRYELQHLHVLVGNAVRVPNAQLRAPPEAEPSVVGRVAHQHDGLFLPAVGPAERFADECRTDAPAPAVEDDRKRGQQQDGRSVAERRAGQHRVADQAPFLFGDESQRGNVTAGRPQAIGEILLFAVGDLRRAESLLDEAVNRRKLLRPFGTYRHDLRFLRFLTSYFSDAYAAPTIGVGMGSRRQTAAAR